MTITTIKKEEIIEQILVGEPTAHTVAWVHKLNSNPLVGSAFTIEQVHTEKTLLEIVNYLFNN
ncbi:MAG: hypothetical protein ACOH2V_00405 [Candidatus Saccharimonadaceae bacterium]